MKVLMVGRYGSVKGGAEAYVRELSRGLRDAGHEVALAYRFDPDETRPEVRAGTQLAAITSQGAQPTVQEAAEVQRAVDAFRPDVVHVHNVEASWLPSFLTRFAPVVSGVHDHRLDCPTGTRYWAAWGRACDIAPGGRCLGYNVAAHCGSLRANATLEPYLRWRRLRAAAQNGPQIQVFSEYMAGAVRKVGVQAEITVTPYPAPAMPEPRALALEDSRPVVFAAGRITKEKGFDLLLAALEHVSTPVRLVVAGDGHHLAALRRRPTPPRHRVDFLGWTDRETQAAWYTAAALVAVPSAWPEPFGIVGLEAMSFGKPVVASDIGGIREWLVDGETGIAVMPRDVRGFAGAIERLLEDAPLRERLGDAGRLRVQQLFTLDRHVALVEDMYASARKTWEAAA